MKTHVGPYRIDELLGRGGMGVVYRGTHEHLARQVAIKELAPELTRQPEFKDRFFAEARTQARLHHPNIVTVFDLIEDDGDYFIVMEYVAGRTCDELLRERAGSGLGLSEAVGIFSQVLAALDYAHSEGVIHRDVKPSNVLLSDDGRVKLMDFGIALLVGDKRLTASQASIGTPVYMSPEQILRPREMDHRTDIYSAAIVFYELIAGAPPFDGESMYEISKLQVEAPPPDLACHAPGVPRSVAAVVTRALAKSPEQRFTSAGEMLRSLREAVPHAAWGIPAPATDPPLGGGSPKTAGSMPVKVVAPPKATGPLSPPAGRSGGGRALRISALAGAAAVILGLLTFGWAHRSASPAPSVVGSSLSSPPEPPSAPSPSPSAPASGVADTGPARESGGPAPAALPEGAGEKGGGTGTGLPPDRDARTRRSGAIDPGAGRAIDQETHRRELAGIRETLRQGITRVREDLDAERFGAARERITGLQETAVPYRAELIEEVAQLRALDQQITSAQISAKTDSLIQQQEAAKWQQRLEEIRSLIQEKNYPEAKTLALKLASETGVGEKVAAEARELGAQADSELKAIFSKTRVKATDEVVKKPPH